MTLTSSQLGISQVSTVIFLSTGVESAVLVDLLGYPHRLAPDANDLQDVTRQAQGRDGLEPRHGRSRGMLSGRRAVLGLVAAGFAGGSVAKAVLAEAKGIKVGPPPPPSGGLRKCPAHSFSYSITFSRFIF